MNGSFDIQVNTDQIADIKNRIGEFISKMYTVYEEISKNKDELVTNEYWTGKTYDEFVGKFDEWKPKFIAFLNEMSLVDLYLDSVIQLSQSIIDKRDSIFSDYSIDKSVSPSNKTILQYHKNSGNDLLTKITDWEGDVGQIQCRINNLDNRINDISSDGRIVAASNIESIIRDSKENKRIMDTVWHTFMDTCRLNMGSFINYIAGYDAMFNGMIDKIRNENIQNTTNGSTQLIKNIIEDNEYNNNLKQIADELGVSRRDAEILLMAMSDEGQQLLDNDPKFQEAVMKVIKDNKDNKYLKIITERIDDFCKEQFTIDGQLGKAIMDSIDGAVGKYIRKKITNEIIAKGLSKLVSFDTILNAAEIYTEASSSMDDTWDVVNYSDPNSVENAHEVSAAIQSKASLKAVVLTLGVVASAFTGGVAAPVIIGAVGTGLNMAIDYGYEKAYGNFDVNQDVSI